MNALEYDPVTSFLEELARKVRYAEEEIADDPLHCFERGLTKRWWIAYLNYHCARIETETSTFIPCPECEGTGYKDITNWKGEQVRIPCHECDASGKYPCDACGEHPAVTRNEDHDALCAKCAGE